jgi:hypothetical protein
LAREFVRQRTALAIVPAAYSARIGPVTRLTTRPEKHETQGVAHHISSCGQHTRVHADVYAA